MSHAIVLQYLQVLLTWPVVALICFLLFVHVFKTELKNLLDRIKKIYGAEFGQKEQQEALASRDADLAESLKQEGITLTHEEMQNLGQEFQNLTDKTNEMGREIQNKDQLIKYAIERAELYEFAYLDKVLVPNTKRALLWFFMQPNHESIKEYFFSNFDLVIQQTNEKVEKEAIFNALVVNGLLDNKMNTALFAVTQKGEKFLKSLRLIAQ